jgi:hypothetical protein
MNTLAHTVGHADTPVYRRHTPTLLQVIGRSIWRSLEAVGHRRAARELDQLASRWTVYDPALARELREASRNETRLADELQGGNA